MAYLSWDTQKLAADSSSEEIEALYGRGYVLTRVERGLMNQTRSFRVDLRKFEPSSENRRVLRKAEHLKLAVEPIPYERYSWQVGKLAKDFYAKFGDHVFSANKVRELLTDGAKSNFNRLLLYIDGRDSQTVGYAIVYRGERIVHYAFPFYIQDPREPSRGLGMMTMMLLWAKETGKDYAYLGSLSRPSDTYKLQFKGGEWFDGERWCTDIEPLKEILR